MPTGKKKPAMTVMPIKKPLRLPLSLKRDAAPFAGRLFRMRRAHQSRILG